MILFQIVVVSIIYSSLFFVSSALCFEKFNTELTPEEIDYIYETANKMPLSDAIGQLLVVGVPGDIKNYIGNNNLEKFVNELKVGNIFFSGYHYYEKDANKNLSTVDQIFSYHNSLRERYKSSKLPPPILFVDYENTKINCFKNQNILQPIPALTLAATNDETVVRLAGQYAGYQLRALGVDGIFGPVVDVEGTPQGIRNELIGNRSFGGTPEIVCGAGSQYLFGLKDANILTFIKHYPGHGYANGEEFGVKNHLRFYGGLENFKSNVQPFRELGKYADGIMSSQILTSQFEPNMIATFSSKIMVDLLRNSESIKFGEGEIEGLSLPDTLLITDDLSNTGAIQKYMRDNHISYDEIALRALKSGHDLLLFSHLETEKIQRGYFGKFAFKELNSVIITLIDAASKNSIFEQKIRSALFRVLKTKARLLKSWNSNPVENILSWSGPKKINTSILQPSFLKTSDYKNAQNLNYEIFKKSFLKIMGNNDNNSYANFPDLIFVNDHYSAHFNEGIDRKQSKIIGIPSDWKKTLSWEDFKKLVLTETTNALGRIFFIFTGTVDDINLLEYMASITDDKVSLRNRIYILLHTSPKWLPQLILSDFNVLGNFSNNPTSFEIDKEFMNGRIVPSNLSKLPISLGEEGEIHSPKMYICPAKNLKSIDIYSTTTELELKQKISNLLKKLDGINANLEKAVENEKESRAIANYMYKFIGLQLFLLASGAIFFMVKPVIANIAKENNNEFKKIFTATLIASSQLNKLQLIKFLIISFVIVFGFAIFFDFGFVLVYDSLRNYLLKYLLGGK